MSDLEFCNFVMLQYPPVHKTKDQYEGGFPQDDLDYDWVDVLKKLLGLYHPDKIDIQIWGIGHKVIAQLSPNFNCNPVSTATQPNLGLRWP